MKVIQAAQLVLGILTGDTARGGPFFVNLDVTGRCNLRCVGCRSHAPGVEGALAVPAREDISYDLVRRLCGEMRQAGTRRLGLIGDGEPLLHPRIIDIIQAGKSAGLEVFLLTNGTLVDETMARSLVSSGIDNIRVSVWATCPEDYARVHPGTPAAMFGRIMDGVRLLVQEKSAQRRTGLRIGVHCPLDRWNFATVEQFAQLALDAGADAVSFSPLLPMRGRLAAEALDPGQEQILRASLKRLRSSLGRKPIRHNIGELLSRYEVGQAVWDKYPCYVGWIDARIKTNGDVVPCNPCELRMGNLYANSLREIWNSPGYRRFRRRTRTRTGLRALADGCDCGFCCHVLANQKMHRLFRATEVLRGS